jgi:hypothetical protein
LHQPIISGLFFLPQKKNHPSEHLYTHKSTELEEEAKKERKKESTQLEEEAKKERKKERMNENNGSYFFLSHTN